MAKKIKCANCGKLLDAETACFGKDGDQICQQCWDIEEERLQLEQGARKMTPPETYQKCI